MPVGCDGVEGPVTASAITALHHRITPAQTLTHLRQPGIIGRLIVLVRVDRILQLFADEAAGVNQIAMSRLEIDTVDEIAIDWPALGKVWRTTKERNLGAASLDRQG